MRWCHHCRHYNQGWPGRCRHCSAGLNGRLCPRNHINPVDRRLGFCGDCGEPLEQTWGAGFSVRPYVIAVAMALLTLLTAAGTLSLPMGGEPMAACLVALLVVVIGFRLAFSVLPPGARNLIALIVRGLGKGIHMLLFGTGYKGGR